MCFAPLVLYRLDLYDTPVHELAGGSTLQVCQAPPATAQLRAIPGMKPEGAARMRSERGEGAS